MNRTQREAAAAQLTDAKGKVLDAISAYNDLCVDLDEMARQYIEDRLAEAKAAVETTATALEEQVEAVREQLDGHIDDRSETWQESETGERWREVLQQFEAFDITELTNIPPAVTLRIDELDNTVVDDLSDTLDALENL